MPDNDDTIENTEDENENLRPEFELIEKIKILNIKKGDVIILRYAASPPLNLPRDAWTQMLTRQIKEIKKFVKENWGGYVGLISVPDTIDFEVMRLEEWFV